MATSPLLQGHYLIFLLPLGAAALLLVLSSLRFGGGHRGLRSQGGGNAHGRGHHHAARHAATTARHVGGKGHTGATAHPHPHRSFAEILAALTGWRRAPLPLVVDRDRDGRLLVEEVG